MPAYLIIEHKITDAAKFEQYRVAVGPILGEAWSALLDEGRQPQVSRRRPLASRARRLFLSSPAWTALDAWYTSPEYQPLIGIRKSCTSDLDMMIALEGV